MLAIRSANEMRYVLYNKLFVLSYPMYIKLYTLSIVSIDVIVEIHPAISVAEVKKFTMAQ